MDRSASGCTTSSASSATNCSPPNCPRRNEPTLSAACYRAGSAWSARHTGRCTAGISHLHRTGAARLSRIGPQAAAPGGGRMPCRRGGRPLRKHGRDRAGRIGRPSSPARRGDDGLSACSEPVAANTLPAPRGGPCLTGAMAGSHGTGPAPAGGERRPACRPPYGTGPARREGG